MMAYMDQARKEKLVPAVKAILKKYRLKGSLSVRNHSTLVLTIASGPIDFIGTWNRVVKQHPRYNEREFTPAEKSLSVNTHWYQEHFDGKALAFLKEVIPAMNSGNHDRSDIQTDYFDVGWYLDVSIGRWNKPYQLIA